MTSSEKSNYVEGERERKEPSTATELRAARRATIRRRRERQLSESSEQQEALARIKVIMHS